jgi:hypothetical protein
MSDDLFPCPSCGFLVFSEAPGSYEICSLCGWEDDHVQLAHPGMGGGANTDSLVAHQRAALERFPIGVTTSGEFVRSRSWRPLRPEEATSPNQPFNGVSYFNAAAEEAPLYYWLRDAAL